MKWFYNLKISIKLLMGFLMVALIAGSIGYIGIVNINKIERLDTELYEKMTAPLGELGIVTESFQKMRVNLKDIVLSVNETEINEYEQRIKARNEDFVKNLTSFKKTLLTDEGKAVISKMEESKVKYDALANRVVQLVKDNKRDEAIALLRAEEETTRKQTEDALTQVVEMKLKLASQASDSNTKTAKTATVTMTVLLISGMVISVILGIFISSSINKPIKKIIEVSNKISKGDMDVTIDIDTKDELGALAETFRVMANNINDVMVNISAAAGQVASGSRQLSEGSQGLSQGATEQASSIEELTTSMTQIAAQTKQNAANANLASELAVKASENAEQGNLHMQEMLKSMEQINDSSSNIFKIIKVIDEIAFQTNILALNAAVEAARAGQHGKGFAVVAEEVRNLAARSANAAKETSAMIEGSIKKVEAGTKTANETARALDDIVKTISKATGLVSEIASASNEQATGIAQINKGIEQVSQVIQTNSATAEESAAASEELNSQAEVLREMVQKFKLKNSSLFRNKTKTIQWDKIEVDDEMDRNIDLNQTFSFSARRSQPAEGFKKPKIVLSDRELGKYQSFDTLAWQNDRRH